MTVWVIAENGERVKLVDNFTHRIYVSGKFSDLKSLTEKIRDSRSVAGCRFVKKYADLMDVSEKKVLEIDVNDYRGASFLAGKILRLGGYEKFRLHNVDVPISQAYLYERDAFPLAHVIVVDSGKNLCYDILDSVESVDYDVPPFRSMWLNVDIKKEGVLQRFTDKIDSVSLDFGNKTIVISEGTEEDKILGLVETVKKEDADLIFTHGGDSFIFPYLTYRAFVNGVLNRFILSRENIPLKTRKSRGRTFFSYGRVYHKAPRGLVGFHFTEVPEFLLEA